MFEATVVMNVPTPESVAMLLAADPSRLTPSDAAAGAAGAVKARRLLEAIELSMLAHAQGGRRYEGEVSSVGQELSAATGMHPSTATARADLGCAAVSRLPTALKLLAAGELTYRHLEKVEQATRELTDDEARAVDAEAMPAGSRGLNRRVAESIERIAPQHARDKAKRAELDRSGIFWNDAVEGVGGVHVQGPLAKSAQIKAAIDQDARLRTAGDCRPLAARRFDVLYDWARAKLGLAPSSDPTDAAPTSGCASTIVTSSTDSSSTGSGAGPAHDDTGACGSCGRSSEPTRFPINVTVSLETLLRLTDVPGDLNGDPIPAEVARELAADGRWRRWILEPATGRLLDVGAHTYRPGAAVDRYVRGRDRTCRFPSCTTPAVRCELDHRKAFHTQGGETVCANLDCLCPMHHHLKHDTWRTEAEPDGTIVWTAPSGRRYEQPPEDHGGDDPVLSDYLARGSARRRAREAARSARSPGSPRSTARAARGAPIPKSPRMDPWSASPDVADSPF